jgi:hypothetical protein
MVDICQQQEHPTVQGIVDGLMNLYSCVADMLLGVLLGYLTFDTTAFDKCDIQELAIFNTQHRFILYNPQENGLNYFPKLNDWFFYVLLTVHPCIIL